MTGDWDSAITGVLQQLFNAADLAVVGQFSGKEAMAAVGGNAPVIGLLVNLFVGISLGSNVIIAKSIGQRDNENISKAVHTSVIVALLGGLFIRLSGYLRGFGVSFIPAACAVIGICGVRLTWIFTMFQKSPSFTTIMQVYPLSLGITAAVILIVTLFVKPSKQYAVQTGV